jgi:large subunit ribosomal protein L17
MRHLKHTAKLGRKSEHRNAMLANLVCSLIKHNRVITTLPKAKAARSLAEKMVTLAKKGSIHARRLAVARLHQEDAVGILFKNIAPQFKSRNGGYTRIVKLAWNRFGDAAPMAIIEWCEGEVVSQQEQSQTAAQQPTPEQAKNQTETLPASDKTAETTQTPSATSQTPESQQEKTNQEAK